ncbi:MAG: glycerol-3-phosphate dehydrogenase [Wenzhouxiangellaceae bacterium]|nr:glycerol-3-phosphate dehydrogenase [Wenzhouxiangellaceae bacterium]
MKCHDLFIIGGGINGVGIARDAAGRGLDVALCEQHDLASHTSSASTKLIHGGLRYLEDYEFRLVRKALVEREILLHNAPHIIWPLRFVLPHHGGLRPKWMLRLGLLLYDLLGGRSSLPRTRRVNLGAGEFAGQLQPDFSDGFAYSDCWVEDARLVALNALDAAERGAKIMTHTRCIDIRRDLEPAGGQWRIRLAAPDGTTREVCSRMLVNAAGPWSGELSRRIRADGSASPVRLVSGSHIVVPQVYSGDHAFLFQSGDGRVAFAIPYEHHYTLIGTTEQAVGDPDQSPAISAEEQYYLCALASDYFARPVREADIVWSYSGIRALYDDQAESMSETTRDYVLELDHRDGVAALSVLGGKLTTYRKLAEDALARLEPFAPGMGGKWTADTPLPGGDFEPDAFDRKLRGYCGRYPFLGAGVVCRMLRAYGTRLERIVAQANAIEQLGEDFGCGLYEAELRYLVDHEFAVDAEDVLWRRSKLGLHMRPEQRERVTAWFRARNEG